MTIVKHPQFKNFHEVRHPLILDKLTHLRDKNTNKKTFQELIYEITLLLVYEVTRDLPLTTNVIETPLEKFDAPVLALAKQPVILPILRAGIGMVDGFLSLMPNASVGHIGLYRDEDSLQPHQYYFKMPKDAEKRHCYVCDPMLATGGSVAAAISQVKKVGVQHITFVCVVAVPEGITHLNQAHPDIPIYCASLDRQLNEHGYILPGLGDAGDRLFGTK